MRYVHAKGTHISKNSNESKLSDRTRQKAIILSGSNPGTDPVMKAMLFESIGD